MRGKVLVVHDDSLNTEQFIQYNELFVNSAKNHNIVLEFKKIQTFIHTLIIML